MVLSWEAWPPSFLASRLPRRQRLVRARSATNRWNTSKITKTFNIYWEVITISIIHGETDNLLRTVRNRKLLWFGCVDGYRALPLEVRCARHPAGLYSGVLGQGRDNKRGMVQHSELTGRTHVVEASQAKVDRWVMYRRRTLFHLQYIIMSLCHNSLSRNGIRIIRFT